MPLLLSMLTSAAFAAECAEPLESSTFDADLERAMAAWRDVDEASFHEVVGRLSAGLPCLESPLRAEQAARLHRILGISKASAGDLDAAALSFAAARAADPALTLPVPEKHPLLAVFSAVSLEQEESPLSLPREGELIVDGAAAVWRVDAWPAVVQWVVDDEVRRTELLAPGETSAPWPAPAPILADAPSEPVSSRGNPTRELPVPRIVAAGGAAALAGGLWLGSAAQAGRFSAAGEQLLVSPSESVEQLSGARQGANLLGAAALGSAAAAAGLGLSVVLTF